MAKSHTTYVNFQKFLSGNHCVSDNESLNFTGVKSKKKSILMHFVLFNFQIFVLSFKYCKKYLLFINNVSNGLNPYFNKN